MAHWLLKTEPDSFGWSEQVARGAKGEPWTGVRNFAAARHLRAMRKGEQALFYHTGEEKQIVGTVEVIREAYPDPTDDSGKFVCVDVAARAPFPRPVTLAEIKADKRFADMLLVRQPRLSVQPVSEAEWKAICELGGL